jgi:putative oxidoreductase
MPFVEKITRQLPEFQGSNWLLRIPFAIIFIQQGLSKMPVTAADAEVYNLPMSIWFFVAWGELFAGFGLLVGGLLRVKFLWPSIGDLITRFSGVVIAGIMTGVILILEPPSIQYIMLHDTFHVILYFGGLFFALRGNRVK